MKITKQELKEMIKEEVIILLNEVAPSTEPMGKEEDEPGVKTYDFPEQTITADKPRAKWAAGKGLMDTDYGWGDEDYEGIGKTREYFASKPDMQKQHALRGATADPLSQSQVGQLYRPKVDIQSTISSVGREGTRGGEDYSEQSFDIQDQEIGRDYLNTAGMGERGAAEAERLRAAGVEEVEPGIFAGPETRTTHRQIERPRRAAAADIRKKQ